jgi:surface carbohydrate biosynthesis protein (TIGR04326 family)
VPENKTVLIWDADSGEMPEHDVLVTWNSYQQDVANNKISIPHLVEDNSGKFKSQFLSLIYDLGEAKINGKRVIEYLEIRPNFSYWWMTLLSEKCNYAKSPQINNIIKMMAFEEWIKHELPQKLVLITSNTILATALTNTADSLGIDFEWNIAPHKKVNKTFIQKIYHTLPHKLQAIVWLIKNAISHWSLKGVGVNEWKNTRAKSTFISYFFNIDSKSLEHDRFSSRYWKELLDLLEKENIKTNWLQIFVPSDLFPTSKYVAAAITKLNKSYKEQQVHVALHSFLSLKLLFFVLCDWYKLIKLKSIVEIPLKNNSGSYWPLIEEDYLSSLTGSTAMSSLLYLHLFEQAISSLPRQTRGFYLQENQDWELGFISAWRNYNHANHLIGFPHTTVIYWDLRYFFDVRTYKQKDNLAIPLPDKVGVNGEEAKAMYVNGGYPKEDIVEVEALRFLYLNSIKKNNQLAEKIIDKRKSLLILSDYLFENVVVQMKLLLEAQAFMNSEIRYVLKPHPGCPVMVEDFPEIDLSVTNENIDVLLNDYGVVFTSNATSAAVDAYCLNKSVITVLDPATLNFSPLKDNGGVLFVSTARELAVVLEEVFDERKKKEQHEEFFYLDAGLPRWRKLLSDRKFENQASLEAVQ